MVSLLFPKLKKNTPPDAATRLAVGKRCGWIGILCNLLLAGGKLFAGILSGSVSIIADGMNNLSDASGSLVTLLGFHLAEKPADADHPYGHARFEYLSGLAVSAIILIIGFELGQTSVEKIFAPADTQFSLLTAGILVASMVIKLWLSWLNSKLGKTIGSSALLAAATDSRNDCIATGAVFVSALIEHFTQVHIDGYIGLAVAAFILYSGITMGKETISPLLGEAASPELRRLIVDYIRNQPDVLGYHDLMVHDYGPGQRFASLHVEMSSKQDPLYCHERIDDMERECLQSHNIHLVIHYDPVVTDNPIVTEMRTAADRLLQGIDPRLKTHDFRMVQGEEHTNLIFDISLPEDLRGKEAAIKTQLETSLSDARQQKIYAVITFDPAAFNEYDDIM